MNDPKYIAGNVCYVRNLAPHVTEEQVREFFEPCGQILKLEFKCFPNTTQRYGVIEFDSAAGVTQAARKHGELLNHVPIFVSVTNPETTATVSGMSTLSTSALAAAAAQANLSTGSSANASVLLEMAMQSHYSNIQAVQSAAEQAKVLAQQKLAEFGVPSSKSQHNTFEYQGSLERVMEAVEAPILARTVCIEGLPADFTSKDVIPLFDAVGTVTACRVDDNPIRKLRYALVEFESEELAQLTVEMDEFTIRGKKVTISKSLTTVHAIDPSALDLEFPPDVMPPVPAAYQQVQRARLEEKLTRVRAIESRLFGTLRRRIRSPDYYRYDASRRSPSHLRSRTHSRSRGRRGRRSDSTEDKWTRRWQGRLDNRRRSSSYGKQSRGSSQRHSRSESRNRTATRKRSPSRPTRRDARVQEEGMSAGLKAPGRGQTRIEESRTERKRYSSEGGASGRRERIRANSRPRDARPPRSSSSRAHPADVRSRTPARPDRHSEKERRRSPGRRSDSRPTGSKTALNGGRRTKKSEEISAKRSAEVTRTRKTSRHRSRSETSNTERSKHKKVVRHQTYMDDMLADMTAQVSE